MAVSTRARKSAAPAASPNGHDGAEEAPVQLLQLRKAFVQARIVGTTPLIPHSWSEKSRRGLPGHPGHEEISAKKAPHDPEAEARACLYLLGDERMPLEERLGIKATAIKSAMITAVSLFEGLTKVSTKMCLFVTGEGPEQLVPVRGELLLREDPARNANGSVDLRYRYQIFPWEADVRIVYISSVLTQDSVLTLLNAAGMAGIGDWRPSAPKSQTGTYGQWHIDRGSQMYGGVLDD